MEPRDALRVLREGRGQHLDRDLATKLRVDRAVASGVSTAKLGKWW